MAFTYGFYDSINHDRRYTADQVSSLFDGLITDGVFDTIGEKLSTIPGEDLQVLVKPGKAWFDHTWSINDADYPLYLDTADVTMSRIDAIVLEIDKTESVRANSLKVIKGTAATNPTRPRLTNTERVHQYPLSYVTIPGSATSIRAQDIDIVVGMSATPFVTGLVEHVDITDLFSKWNGEFDTWFDNLKAQLSDNVVTNLQAQIDDKVDKKDKATKEEVIAGTDDTKWVTPAGLKTTEMLAEMPNGSRKKLSFIPYYPKTGSVMWKLAQADIVYRPTILDRTRNILYCVGNNTTSVAMVRINLSSPNSTPTESVVTHPNGFSTADSVSYMPLVSNDNDILFFAGTSASNYSSLYCLDLKYDKLQVLSAPSSTTTMGTLINSTSYFASDNYIGYVMYAKIEGSSPSQYSTTIYYTSRSSPSTAMNKYSVPSTDDNWGACSIYGDILYISNFTNPIATASSRASFDAGSILYASSFNLSTRQYYSRVFQVAISDIFQSLSSVSTYVVMHYSLNGVCYVHLESGSLSLATNGVIKLNLAANFVEKEGISLVSPSSMSMTQTPFYIGTDYTKDRSFIYGPYCISYFTESNPKYQKAFTKLDTDTISQIGKDFVNNPVLVEYPSKDQISYPRGRRYFVKSPINKIFTDIIGDNIMINPHLTIGLEDQKLYSIGWPNIGTKRSSGVYSESVAGYYYTGQWILPFYTRGSADSDVVCFLNNNPSVSDAILVYMGTRGFSFSYMTKDCIGGYMGLS